MTTPCLYREGCPDPLACQANRFCMQLRSRQGESPSGTTSKSGLQQARKPDESPALLSSNERSITHEGAMHEFRDGYIRATAYDKCVIIDANDAETGDDAEVCMDMAEARAFHKWLGVVLGAVETSCEPHPLKQRVDGIVSAMRSVLGRQPPYYCNEIRLPAEGAEALLSYIADLQQFHDWALPQITNPPFPAETNGDGRPRHHDTGALLCQNVAPALAPRPGCNCMACNDVRNAQKSTADYGPNCPRHPGAMFKPSDGCPTCEVGGAPYVLDANGNIPSASTDDTVSPSRAPPSSVECPKCRTQLAFEGDVCGLCE